MAKRINGLLDELAVILNDLPAVFSTPQWGGRAYKVGREGKAKVLAHVCLTKGGDAVTVSFKLAPERARDLIERHEWIAPHSFRTLAPAGWLTAQVTTKRQVGTLGRLLAESHGLHPVPAENDASPRPRPAASETARHIDRVMGEVSAEGWTPPSDW